MKLHIAGTQPTLDFPVSLTERFRPRRIEDFVGLDKPKKICTRLAANPFESAWLFKGPSGTGKTTLALTLADLIPAELHHIPSQECTKDRIEAVGRMCQYAPMFGQKWRVVLVDEADQMSNAAQISLLSRLDATNPAPNTIWIFTCNDTERLESRFLSRLGIVEFSSYGIAQQAIGLLERIWKTEAPEGAAMPNLARLVKDSNNNVRESLMLLQTELLLA